MLTEMTAPAPDAGLARDLAARLRLPDDPTQDPALAAALDQAAAAALRIVERAASRALLRRRCRFVAEAWREGVALPIAPIAALNRVAEIDEAGVATDLPAADFEIDDFRPAPTVLRVAGAPTPAPRGRALIEFDAGYGPDWVSVPSELRAAVVAQGAHLFRRDAGEENGGPGLCPDAALLLEPYRAVRL